MVCVHGAPSELKRALLEEWANCTAERAYQTLSNDDVQVGGIEG